MKSWTTDNDLFVLVRGELFTCGVGDVMDKLELQHQFLPPQIRPLRADLVVIARSFPVLAVDACAEKVAGAANQSLRRFLTLDSEIKAKILSPDYGAGIGNRL